MARTFAASFMDAGQSTNNVDLSGTNKATLAFWMYWNLFANDDHLAFESSANWTANAGSFIVDPDESITGKFFVGVFGNVGQNAAAYTRPSAATWYHYVFTMDFSQAANEVNLYINGTLQVPSSRPATNNNTGNFGSYKLNFMCRNGASLFAAGRLAEIGLWSGITLSADDATALSLGYRPIHVRPDKLAWYWPMHFPEQSTEPELIAQNGNVLVGTSNSDHPLIIY